MSPWICMCRCHYHKGGFIHYYALLRNTNSDCALSYCHVRADTRDSAPIMYRLWVYTMTFVRTFQTVGNVCEFSVCLSAHQETTICLCFLLLRCTESVKGITTHYKEKEKYVFFKGIWWQEYFCASRSMGRDVISLYSLLFLLSAWRAGGIVSV